MTNRPISEFAVGDEIIIGTRKLERRDGKNVHAVVERRRARVSRVADSGFTVSENGTDHEFDRYGQPHDLRGFRVLWSLPIPQGNEDAVDRYCVSILEGADAYGALLWVVSTDEDHVEAAFITDAEKVDATNGEIPPHTAYGNNVVLEDLLVIEGARTQDKYRPGIPSTTWRTGDLIVAHDYDCVAREDRQAIRPSNWTLIANFDNLQDILDFLPSPVGNPHSIIHGDNARPGSVHKLLFEQGLAVERTKPDRALVWVRRDSDNHLGLSILTHEGGLFYQWDDAVDVLEIEDEGLWVFENAKGWSHQDADGWDSGIDGDWKPATVEDVTSFGLSMETLVSKMQGYTEYDEPSPDADTAFEAMRNAANATGQAPLP